MARNAPAPALPFSDPWEPGRVLPQNGRLWWTLSTIRAGRMQQHPHRLSDLELTLDNVNPGLDTYVSQGIFDRPNRRALNIAWMSHAWVDLDTYRVPVLAAFTPDQIARQILDFCTNDTPTPLPSVIVSSGRGLYAKWMFADPIPKPAAGKCVAVNRELVKRFTSFGADPKSCDASRILRVVGTLNTKNDEMVRLVWANQQDRQSVRYDFELLADELLPYTSDQIRDFRGSRAQRATVFDLRHERRLRDLSGRRPGKRVIWADWHWKVLCDIEALAASRFPGGIVQQGWRDIFGFLGACQLARTVSKADLWHECLTWGRRILPAEYLAREYRQHVSSLLSRVRRAQAGEVIIIGSREISPIYTFRKSTLIELLEITNTEMLSLHVLIDEDEKRRRRRTQRSLVPRDVYEATARERRIAVAAARAAGRSLRRIAKDIGISLAEAQRLSLSK